MAGGDVGFLFRENSSVFALLVVGGQFGNERGAWGCI